MRPAVPRNGRRALRNPASWRDRCPKDLSAGGLRSYWTIIMPAELLCFEPSCRARYAIDAVLYSCPKCGGLLEARIEAPAESPELLKSTWRQRRTCNTPLDQSGVWRYREL